MPANLEPILQARCVMCHASAAPSAGLALDGLDALLAGSARGPLVVPRDPDASERVRRLRGESLPRMPLTGEPYLSDEEIDLFVRWIAAGAEHDSGGEPDAGAEPDAPAGAATGTTPAPRGPVTSAQVEPILVQNCVRCHTANGVMGPAPEGYRLDDAQIDLVVAWIADGAREVDGTPAPLPVGAEVLAAEGRVVVERVRGR